MTALAPLSTRKFMNHFMTDPFDLFMNAAPAAPATRPSGALMRTDIKEAEGGYEITVDLPGYKKENVEISLKDDYLYISAQTADASESSSEDGTWIRKERFNGTCRRSFYLGDEIDDEAISARFEDGVLQITVPKKAAEPEAEEKKIIAIA